MFDVRGGMAAMLVLAGVATAGVPALVPAAAQSAPNGQQILAQVDKIRNPAASFAVDNTATEYRSGKPVARADFVVQSKLNRATGQYRNLIGYVAPTRDAGKLMLMNGPAMWFYDPNARQSIRISPQQRLIGGAANADILSINLARDYKSGPAVAETVVDADRKNRSSWRLVLTPASPSAAYGKIDYWVDAGSKMPVKARFYADSKRLLKTVFYTDFKPALGGLRATKVVIIDQLDPAHVTTMMFRNYRLIDLPDAQFEREYLPRAKVR